MLWCTVCLPDLSHALPYHLYALLHLSSLLSQNLQLVLGLLLSTRFAAGKFRFLAWKFYCGMSLRAFWSLWVIWGSSRAIICLSVAEQSSCSILVSSVLFLIFCQPKELILNLERIINVPSYIFFIFSAFLTMMVLVGIPLRVTSSIRHFNNFLHLWLNRFAFGVAISLSETKKIISHLLFRDFVYVLNHDLFA